MKKVLIIMARECRMRLRHASFWVRALLVPALRTARPVPPTERPSHAEWQSIRLPAVSARYVRVSAEGGLPCGLMSVAELDVR